MVLMAPVMVMTPMRMALNDEVTYVIKRIVKLVDYVINDCELK